MIDPRARFTVTAHDYAAARPDYPEALFDWLLSLGTFRDAVDLGSGTGISTRQLGRRLNVVGVEPNAAMRAEAEALGGRYVAGEASATSLPDASTDLVIAAQAFHWFPLQETLAEIRRILRPGGWACAFWNTRRQKDPLMRAYDDLLCRTSAEYKIVSRQGDTLKSLRAAVTGAKEARFPHLQRLDRAGLHQRADSSSYVVHGVADKPAFHVELDALFDRFAVGGLVTFPYDTVAVAWPR